MGRDERRRRGLLRPGRAEATLPAGRRRRRRRLARQRRSTSIARGPSGPGPTAGSSGCPGAGRGAPTRRSSASLSAFPDSPRNPSWSGPSSRPTRVSSSGRASASRSSPRTGRSAGSPSCRRRSTPSSRSRAPRTGGSSRGTSAADSSSSTRRRFAVVRRLSTGEGLPGPSVTAILVSRGRVLLGTEDGLAVLDGGRVTTWGTREGLVNPRISAIAEDRDGGFWLATPGSGVMRVSLSGNALFRESDGLGLDRLDRLREKERGDLRRQLELDPLAARGPGLREHPPRAPAGLRRRHRGASTTVSSRTTTGASGSHRGRAWCGSRPVRQLEELARTAPRAVYTTRDGLASDDLSQPLRGQPRRRLGRDVQPRTRPPHDAGAGRPAASSASAPREGLPAHRVADPLRRGRRRRRLDLLPRRNARALPERALPGPLGPERNSVGRPSAASPGTAADGSGPRRSGKG